MSSIQLSGVFTALITPFHNGEVDYESFGQLIERQIEGGVSGLVPVGTTGECATLSHEEHNALIKFAVECAAGRVPIIAGTGSNSTSEAISLTRYAEEVGAQGVLQVTPYYNKPNQEGLYRHFKAVADSTSLEVMLYSVPGRCGVEIEPQTAARLAEDCPNITSIKEAGGSVERVHALRKNCPAEFAILSGDDPLTLDFIKAGAQGVVSVAANPIPGTIVEMVAQQLSGNSAAAHAILSAHEGIISGLMALDTNPIPVKAALAEMGLCKPEIRLPLVALEGEALAKLRQFLDQADLLQTTA